MTDKVTLSPVSSFVNDTTAVSTVNNNMVAITTAMDNTLSRDGTSPNMMGSNLDMNSNQILNLPSPATMNSPVRLVDVAGNPTITVPPVGTSGAVVGLLNTNNTYSGNNTFTGINTGFRNTVTTITPSAAPSSLGLWDSPLDAFTADISKIYSGVLYEITGVASLGQPATGYKYTPELTPNVTYLYNSSGWNQDTGDNIGRTAATAHRTYMYQTGQGDAIAYNVSAFVNSSRSTQSGGGAPTHFLANPAVTGWAGDFTGGASGVYLNPYEVSMTDAGFDIAGIGMVVNDTRTNDTGALGVVHYGFRTQSNGAKAIDTSYSASGKTKIGIDLTSIITNSSGTWTNAALVLNSADRIYFNGTPTVTVAGYASNTGNDYIAYSSGVTGLILVSGNVAALQITSSQVSLTVPLVSSSTITTSTLTNGSGLLTLGSSTGTIKFGGSGAFTANGAVATALSSVGPTGSHTTVQEWLTITDSAGTVRYIPCF